MYRDDYRPEPRYPASGGVLEDEQFCCVFRECAVCGGDCDGGDACPGPLWYDEDGNEHHGNPPELPADHDEPEERPFPWGRA